VRNLEAMTLTPGPRFNVFSGDNGQGKTNLIEALFAVCTLRSFRTSRLRELIALGEQNALISARVESGGLERIYELKISERSRVVRLDGKSVRPIARYFGGFNVVLFAPEDLLVPRGSPSDRRKFLDRAVFTLEPGFLSVAQDYEKVLKNRNAILRDEDRNPSERGRLLDVFDEQLAGLAMQVLERRSAYLDRVRELFSAAFEAITQSGLPASFVYEPSIAGWRDGVEHIASALRGSRAADLSRGSTNLGPHRDVFEFRLAGQPAASFASQGQLRAMVLAWKTAELDLLSEAHDNPPVLLLDDVSSELDPQRNEYLFEFLRSRKNQCFITTTHPSFVLLDSERRDFRVRAGQVLEG
jgi:DNA replication and repair protein RecF